MPCPVISLHALRPALRTLILTLLTLVVASNAAVASNTGSLTTDRGQSLTWTISGGSDWERLPQSTDDHVLLSGRFGADLLVVSGQATVPSDSPAGRVGDGSLRVLVWQTVNNRRETIASERFSHLAAGSSQAFSVEAPVSRWATAVGIEISSGVSWRPGNPNASSWPVTALGLSADLGPALRTIGAVASPPEAADVTGDGHHTVGSTVTLSAEAHPGWTFVNWRSGGRDISRPWLGGSDLTITVDQDATYEAVFQRDTTGSEPPLQANREDSGVRFSSINGMVGVYRDLGEGEFVIADLDTVLYVNDQIRTEEESSAILSFPDMTTFVMREHTIVNLDTPLGQDSKLRLVLGNIWFNMRKMWEDGSMEITMNQGVTGIRGTVFRLEETGERSTVWLYEGALEFRSLDGEDTVMLEPGQMASASADGVMVARFALDGADPITDATPEPLTGTIRPDVRTAVFPLIVTRPGRLSVQADAEPGLTIQLYVQSANGRSSLGADADGDAEHRTVVLEDLAPGAYRLFVRSNRGTGDFRVSTAMEPSIVPADR